VAESKRAACYLRSSKDRNDVSPAAQRRALHEVAQSRGLTIVTEYSDVEETGKSVENRSAFLDVCAQIKNSHRGWDHLLVYDTARIARRRHIAQAFKHQAKRRGVTIIWGMLPNDLDPISEVMLQSSFEAYDEVLSLMSREKGLMGMRENIARGFRAGGRASMGYQLERVSTGVVRDGKPVTKSRLVPGPDAARMRAYLQGRARGIPRARLAADLGLVRNKSSLVGIEWNALTYAGNTVWNVHSEPGTGSKRRPREEWVIQPGTHEALITSAEAEAILANLVTAHARHIGERVSRGKAAMSDYLLTGLLRTSDGRLWTGKNGRHYKLRASPAGPGKLVACDPVDRTVLAQIAADMRSEQFLETMIEASRRAGVTADPAKPMRDRIAKLEREKAKAAELAIAGEDGGTFAKLVQERSSEIAALRRELDAIAMDGQLSEMVRQVTPSRLREVLLELGSPEAALQAMVDHITLDPDMSLRVHYRPVLGAIDLSMASPRGFEPLLPP
jgi:site-specific DNA recombinase